MPSRNDISSLKGNRRPILSSDRKQEEAQEPVTAKAKTSDKTGRPPLPKSERRNGKVLLSLTQAELDHVASKAGIAHNATYIYHYLRETGLFDDM